MNWPAGHRAPSTSANAQLRAQKPQIRQHTVRFSSLAAIDIVCSNMLYVLPLPLHTYAALLGHTTNYYRIIVCAARTSDRCAMYARVSVRFSSSPFCRFILVYCSIFAAAQKSKFQRANGWTTIVISAVIVARETSLNMVCVVRCVLCIGAYKRMDGTHITQYTVSILYMEEKIRMR